MKLYPCQKIALHQETKLTDVTKEGNPVYIAKCRATSEVAIVEIPLECNIKTLETIVIKKLCEGCEWRECDGKTEEICPV